MNIEKRKRVIKYPFTLRRVYLNLASAVFSIFLAIIFLREAMLVVYYFASTLIILLVTFELKLRLFSVERMERLKNEPLENKPKSYFWKRLILLSVGLIAVFALPLFLTFVLPPYTWFILLISFVSGFGISEILFYFYSR